MLNRKKLIIIACIAIFFLVFAIFFNLAKTIDPSEETYNVTVYYVAGDSTEPFKTYSEDYPEGYMLTVNSPELFGYKPQRDKLSLIVASDVFVVVKYDCLHFETSVKETMVGSETCCYYSDTYCTLCNEIINHTEAGHSPDSSTLVVEYYPTSEEPGKGVISCSHCNRERDYYFSTLTRTIEFGGEELKDMFFYTAGVVYNGYTYTGGELVLLKNYASELDCIFDGIDMSQENWADGLTVNIEYDGWNETVAFCQDHLADIPETFKVRFGNDWRIIMHYSPHVSGNLKSWLNSDSCPLRTSPLKITLTYDFTK